MKRFFFKFLKLNLSGDLIESKFTFSRLAPDRSTDGPGGPEESVWSSPVTFFLFFKKKKETKKKLTRLSSSEWMKRSSVEAEIRFISRPALHSVIKLKWRQCWSAAASGWPSLDVIMHGQQCQRSGGQICRRGGHCTGFRVNKLRTNRRSPANVAHLKRAGKWVADSFQIHLIAI